MRIGVDVVESLRAKFESVLPYLDERGQWLVLAAEARSLGHGGIGAVAAASGSSESRISQGWPSWSRAVPQGRTRPETTINEVTCFL